jgi:hypothetical protein
MIGHKCWNRLFWHGKAGSKQALNQIHLDSTQWWVHQLTCCLVIQRAHINVCYATGWCLKSHSPSWDISTQRWKLTAFLRSVHQLIIPAASSNELNHSMCWCWQLIHALCA